MLVELLVSDSGHAAGSVRELPERAARRLIDSGRARALPGGPLPVAAVPGPSRAMPYGSYLGLRGGRPRA